MLDEPVQRLVDGLQRAIARLVTELSLRFGNAAIRAVSDMIKGSIGILRGDRFAPRLRKVRNASCGSRPNQR